MRQFKVGDKVKLLRAAVGGLVIGNIYTVSEVFGEEWFHVEEPEGLNRRGERTRLSPIYWELIEAPAPKRTMKDVKVGDKVRRIMDEHMNMVVGDVATVTEIPAFGGIGLKEYDGYHSIDNLELVEPEAEPVVQPQPEVVMPYQFKVGDVGKTRDGRLYRVAANDIVTETQRCVLALVKKDEGAQEIVIRARIDGKVYAGQEAGADLLPPKMTVYQLSASRRLLGLALGELGEETAYVSVFDTEDNAKKRKRALEGYYKDLLITPIERDIP